MPGGLLRNGATWGVWALALSSAACGAQSSGSDPAASDPADGTPAADTDSIDDGRTPLSIPPRALPGPCREPAPPQVCLLPEGLPASAIEPSQTPGQMQFVRQLSGSVVAVGEGLVPGDALGACRPGPDVEAAIARTGTQLTWVELDVGGGSTWLSVSAPAEGLPLAVGGSVTLRYVEVDDFLNDFGPTTRSLILRDAAGELLVWLATSASVEGLAEGGPTEIGLSLGQAQCEIVRSCPTLLQYGLGVSVGGASRLELAQGDLASTAGGQVLAGQSEVMRDSGECVIDGAPQLASIGFWRAPD